MTCCSIFEAELSGEIPIIKTSLAGTRLVGRLSVGQYVAVHSAKGTEFLTSGNKQGLLLPTTTTDQGNFVWTCWLHITPQLCRDHAHSEFATRRSHSSKNRRKTFR